MATSNNFLAPQPANSLAYGLIGPTPRNPLLGYLSDLSQGGLDYLRDPRFRQAMMQLPQALPGFRLGGQALPQMIESTGIPQTMQRMAYGQPLTNIGKANVPLLPEDTANAAMTLAPFAGPLIRATKGLPVGMGIKDVSASPFVVYRGGIKGKPITTEGLEPGSVQLGQGAYFGSSKGMAEEYAKYRPEGVVEQYHLNLNTPFDETSKIIPPIEHMQALRKNLLDIGVPKSYVDELDQPYRGAITNLSDAFSKKLTRQGEPTTNWQAADKINAAIRKSGFDGIIADVPEGGEQYVAFSTNQFKPAPTESTALAQPASVADQIDSINEIIKKKRKK